MKTIIEGIKQSEITEDELVSFGFTESGWMQGVAVNYHFHGKHFYFSFDLETRVFEIGVGEYVELGLVLKHIKYIHQIKKLHKLLTND